MKEYIVKGRLDNKTGFMSFTVKKELIRCKDCKHFNPMRKVWRCTQSMVGMISEAEDYCSRAERRGEE